MLLPDFHAAATNAEPYCREIPGTGQPGFELRFIDDPAKKELKIEVGKCGYQEFVEAGHVVAIINYVPK